MMNTPERLSRHGYGNKRAVGTRADEHSPPVTYRVARMAAAPRGSYRSLLTASALSTAQASASLRTRELINRLASPSTQPELTARSRRTYGHTSCTQACRCVVTHRGDVGGDVLPDHRRHEQTSKCIDAVRGAAPSNAGGAATERCTGRWPGGRFNASGRVRCAGPAARRVDVRVVRWADHRQGDGAAPEMVLGVVPPASLGAVSRGLVRALSGAGRRTTRGDSGTPPADPPRLAPSARRASHAARHRPDLQPRPGRAVRRPRRSRRLDDPPALHPHPYVTPPALTTTPG